MSDSKFLITGSQGFLGTHIVENFNKHNIPTVSLVKNSNNISDSSILIGNVNTISEIPNDITHIIHLAALTDIDYCQKNPKECFETNFMGTLNMLEIAKKYKTKFIFASSSQIFGNPDKLPINENAEKNPLSVHGSTKAAAEYLCKSYADLFDLDIFILRLFSVYGPRSPPYSIIGKIITHILNDDEIILGNLTPKRDFIHIDDVLSSLHLLISSGIKGFSTFNIGSGKSISIENLCQKLIILSNKQVILKTADNFIRKSEIPELLCDNNKMLNLGWIPKISLDLGLKTTFEWFKGNLAT